MNVQWSIYKQYCFIILVGLDFISENNVGLPFPLGKHRSAIFVLILPDIFHCSSLFHYIITTSPR